MHRCEVSVPLEVRDLVRVLLCQQRLQLLLLLPLLDEHVIAPVRLRRHITALDVLSAPLLVNHVPIGIFAIVLVLQGDDLVFLFILVLRVFAFALPAGVLVRFVVGLQLIVLINLTIVRLKIVLLLVLLRAGALATFLLRLLNHGSALREQR